MAFTLFYNCHHTKGQTPSTQKHSHVKEQPRILQDAREIEAIKKQAEAIKPVEQHSAMNNLLGLGGTDSTSTIAVVPILGSPKENRPKSGSDARAR